MTKKVYAPGLIVLLSAVCLASIASAPDGWWKTYGGTGNDWGFNVQQTADGGYVMIGWTSSYGAGGWDVYLIKTSAQGDTLWTRTYGGAGDYDVGRSVQQTSDGGYIITGSIELRNLYYSDVFLAKIDTSGYTLWTRSYGGLLHDDGCSVLQISDGGYIIAGLIDQDVCLIRTDTSGDSLWTRTFGGTGYDYCYQVQPTSDSGYIIAGGTSSFGAGRDDFYVIKTTASGDTLWTRTYGGPEDDDGHAVQQTADGGYIVAGATMSFGAGDSDVYVVKTNASGDTQWTRTYGGTDADAGCSILQTSDSGYIIAGYTRSFGVGTPDHDNVYLIRTSASGDTLWTRTFGGLNDDEGYSVQQTTDGGYIITGYARSFGAGDQDVFLIKTDASGNAIAEGPLTRHPARSRTGFLVQPNPFASFARVPGNETELFTISDVTGRQVAVCKGDRIGAGLRPGVYFLSPVGPRASKAVTVTIVKTAF